MTARPTDVTAPSGDHPKPWLKDAAKERGRGKSAKESHRYVELYKAYPTKGRSLRFPGVAIGTKRFIVGTMEQIAMGKDVSCDKTRFGQ